MAKSAQLADDFLSWYLSQAGATLTRPTTIYISLHEGDPGTTGANEKAATQGYARVGVDPSTAFTVSGGVATVASDIPFADATADWTNPISHGGLWNDPTSTAAADFIGGGALTGGAQSVSNGATPKVPAATTIWTET